MSLTIKRNAVKKIPTSNAPIIVTNMKKRRVRCYSGATFLDL